MLALSEKYHRWLRSTNMLERLIREIYRREKVIRIFPRKDSSWRMSGALLTEKHEDGILRFLRSTSWRYLKTEEFYDWLHEQSDAEAAAIESERIARTL